VLRIAQDQEKMKHSPCVRGKRRQKYLFFLMDTQQNAPCPWLLRLYCLQGIAEVREKMEDNGYVKRKEKKETPSVIIDTQQNTPCPWPFVGLRSRCPEH
jgi:hypothetical protein